MIKTEYRTVLDHCVLAVDGVFMTVSLLLIKQHCQQYEVIINFYGFMWYFYQHILAYVTSSNPDSKVHGFNMGPTWVLSAPDGPHVGPMNLAIRGPSTPTALA